MQTIHPPHYVAHCALFATVMPRATMLPRLTRSMLLVELLMARCDVAESDMVDVIGCTVDSVLQCCRV